MTAVAAFWANARRDIERSDEQSELTEQVQEQKGRPERLSA